MGFFQSIRECPNLILSSSCPQLEEAAEKYANVVLQES